MMQIHKKINDIIHHNNMITHQLHNYRYLHPIDMMICDIYYYEPVNIEAFHQLQHFCQNHSTIIELLLSFFRYYAYEFDYRHSVITINNTNMQSNNTNKKSKLYNCESYCWKMNDRLCIEDPFEPWYDVAHVLKPNKMVQLRKEFIVSVFIWSG